jgi:ACT domain-containing protein
MLALQIKIRNLLKRYTDGEIINLLGIPRSTYYRHKDIICNQDKQILYELTKDEIYGQLLYTKESLEKSYSVAMKIAEDENSKPLIRLKACEFANDMRSAIIRLLVEGPRIIANDH